MNREIKFRIYDKLNNKLYCPESIQEIYTQGYTNDKAEDLIFNQYTGLKDKNGREIYEGDIIKWGDRFAIIKFKDGYYYIELCLGKLLSNLLCNENDLTEVIGNIHENPELIKN